MKAERTEVFAFDWRGDPVADIEAQLGSLDEVDTGVLERGVHGDLGDIETVLCINGVYGRMVGDTWKYLRFFNMGYEWCMDRLEERLEYLELQLERAWGAEPDKVMLYKADLRIIKKLIRAKPVLDEFPTVMDRVQAVPVKTIRNLWTSIELARARNKERYYEELQTAKEVKASDRAFAMDCGLDPSASVGVLEWKLFRELAEADWFEPCNELSPYLKSLGYSLGPRDINAKSDPGLPVSVPRRERMGLMRDGDELFVVWGKRPGRAHVTDQLKPFHNFMTIHKEVNRKVLSDLRALERNLANPMYLTYPCTFIPERLKIGRLKRRVDAILWRGDTPVGDTMYIFNGNYAKRVEQGSGEPDVPAFKLQQVWRQMLAGRSAFEIMSSVGINEDVLDQIAFTWATLRYAQLHWEEPEPSHYLYYSQLRNGRPAAKVIANSHFADLQSELELFNGIGTVDITVFNPFIVNNVLKKPQRKLREDMWRWVQDGLTDDEMYSRNLKINGAYIAKILKQMRHQLFRFESDPDHRRWLIGRREVSDTSWSNIEGKLRKQVTLLKMTT